MTRLALHEQQLQGLIACTEKEAAVSSVSENVQAELARMKQELEASTQERKQLERDFKTRMDAWSKEFERRFEREQAPRVAAWSEQFERRMQKLGKDLERKLSGLKLPPLPDVQPPPVAPIAPVAPAAPPAPHP